MVVKKLDLSSLDFVRECARDINETESRLDILVNNAGEAICCQNSNQFEYDGRSLRFFLLQCVSSRLFRTVLRALRRYENKPEVMACFIVVYDINFVFFVYKRLSPSFE